MKKENEVEVVKNITIVDLDTLDQALKVEEATGEEEVIAETETMIDEGTIERINRKTTIIPETIDPHTRALSNNLYFTYKKWILSNASFVLYLFPILLFSLCPPSDSFL